LIVVGPELDSTLCDILVDPGRPFDFAITFPGCMEFYTLDSLLNCCLVSLACGGWFGHEVFVDVVSRREVTDFSTSVSSPNVLDCMRVGLLDLARNTAILQNHSLSFKGEGI
jgi:hypothetical protein